MIKIPASVNGIGQKSQESGQGKEWKQERLVKYIVVTGEIPERVSGQDWSGFLREWVKLV